MALRNRLRTIFRALVTSNKRMAYDVPPIPFPVLDAADHPATDQSGYDMTRTPLTAATARAVIVEICHLAANKPVTSVLICDPRVAAQHSLTRMLRPLQSLIGINCVSDGFGLMDAYSAQPADIVLIGIERSSDTGPEAIALQSAMHPESVIIAFGAATDADLLVAATIAGAQGLLVWDHNQLPTSGDPHPDGPLAW